MARLSGVLDAWCERIGRDPAEIERSILIQNPADAIAQADAYVDHGITHIIVAHDGSAASLEALHNLVAWRDARVAEGASLAVVS